jgi:hypothetical protein
VIHVRTRLSAIAIVAVMLIAGAAPLFANEAAHRPCLAHHRDCTKSTRLTGCCDFGQGDRSNEVTPATGKARIDQTVVGAMAVASPLLALPDLLRRARALTTSPRSSPPDLITLFRTFLI